MGVTVVWFFYQQANSDLNNKAAPFLSLLPKEMSALLLQQKEGGMGAVFESTMSSAKGLCPRGCL